MSLTISFLFLFLFGASNASFLAKFDTRITQNPEKGLSVSSNFAFARQKKLTLPAVSHGNSSRREKIDESNNVIISGNSTIPSENRTFQMGFFSPNGGSKWYLGIRYTSTPTATYVWVANRQTPVTNLASSKLLMTETGKLALIESSNSIIWQTPNAENATEYRFLDNGNLILLSAAGSLLWQSFDYPTDTWLPGMNMTKVQSLTSWRSLTDPSPGLYSLILSPKGYNEFELVFNGSLRYWSTGNWNGKTFTDVPEMTIPYIYKFHFVDPFSPTASFWYTEIGASDATLEPPLTRFRLEVDGQLKQYTWSSQTESWSRFWSRPEDQCKVYSLCGELGLCTSIYSASSKPCSCLSGFRPSSDSDWETGDYSGGCVRETRGLCDGSDKFVEAGAVAFEGASAMSIKGSRSDCERACLGNCSCIGLIQDGRTNFCKNLYGSLLNLRNLSSDSTYQELLFVRVPKGGTSKKDESKSVLLIVGVLASIAISGLAIGMVLVLQMRRKKGRDICEDKDKRKGGGFPMLNLKVFSYKELYAATRGFSDKLGHGGFGAVFQGELLDSTPVAVKRLERPGNGEKEFRAEVCTIGNIQHVNLVRLRGFCSENSHRLLVYDFIQNGPLSVYLRQDGPNLSWDVRYRIAIGTARGIAYLHEGCRDCIIHCDIKPENILLDEDYTAKVSDFGLAKLVCRDFSRVVATMRGTWGYVAPEWISGVAITTKADVYSYGMTLLELLGGRRNVKARPSARGGNSSREGENSEKWFFPPYAAQQIAEGNVAAIVDHRLNRSYKIEEVERVASTAIWCIQDNEESRPTMGMVVKMLEGVVEVPNPPAPKLLQALISGDSYYGIQVDSGNGMPFSDYSGENMGVSGCGSQSSPANASFPVNGNANQPQEGYNQKKAKIANNKENDPLRAEESSSSSSAESSSGKDTDLNTLIDGITRSDSPPADGISVFETTDLHHAPSTLVNDEGGDYPPIQTFEDAKYIWFLESWKLWAIAAPIAFNILCNYGVNSFTNIFVGHIGDIELSAVAIALSVIANFSFGFLLGMGSALETLCGQAYGAGQIELLGIYMQRSWIILFVACFFLLPLYIYATPILNLLGMEGDIAELAGRFTIQILPQMFSLAINFPTQKFLQAQSKVGVLAWIGFGALMIHIVVLYLFVSVFKWGLAGAAAAYDISAWGIALAQVGYVVGWCKDGWTGLSWLAFKDVWGFARLSIASAVMICLEIWYFMTIIVLTGRLEDPVIAVGSLSICMNINGWEGMLFIGINAAISVRVSNELGSSHPRAAKYSVVVTCAESLLIGITFASVVLITKDEFSIIFTDSLEMRKAVSNLAYLLGITMILNSVQPVISGVAVGGGWQALVAYINLFCYYVIGLPLGFLLGYKTSLHVKGIWIGMIIGTSLQTLILVYIICTTNWNKEVEDANERMKKWGAHAEPLPTTHEK